MHRQEFRNLILLFITTYLVFISLIVAISIMPLYVLELGGTDFHAGLQNTAFFIFAVILRLYFGPLADRIGRKKPMYIGAFAFATAPLLFLLSGSVGTLFFARMYQSVGLAAFLSSASSLVADKTPAEKRGSYLGLYRLMMTLAFMSGPPLALWVIHTYGFTHWFGVNTVLGLLSLAAMMPVREHKGAQTEQTLVTVHSVLEVLKKGKPGLMLAGIALVSFTYGAIISYAALYFNRAGGGETAIYFFASGLGGIAANLAGGSLSDHYGRRQVTVPMLLTLGAGTVLLSVAPSQPILAVISGLLMGIGVSGSYLVLIAWLVDVAGDTVRATVLSIQESTIDLTAAVGTFLFGLAAGYWGFSLSYFVLGLLSLGVVPLLFWKRK